LDGRKESQGLPITQHPGRGAQGLCRLRDAHRLESNISLSRTPTAACARPSPSRTVGVIRPCGHHIRSAHHDHEGFCAVCAPQSFVIMGDQTGDRRRRHTGNYRAKRSRMTAEAVPFKVADLSLADFGRREIRLAEHEMPGLMAVRAEWSDSKPLAGARITGSLHMTGP